MYTKFDEDKYKQVQEITNTDYDMKKGFIELNSLKTIVDDLLVEYDSLKEKFEDYKNEVENNYELKEVDPYDFYGVSREDFA